jgi:hypothetical protein
MGALVIQHRVKDYRKWRRAYDAHAPARRKAGLGSAQVYRGADDPLKVAIFFKVKNADRAKAFVESDDLKRVMKAAGVVGKPTITLIATAPEPALDVGMPARVGRLEPREKPAEANADAWARYQQALNVLQKGSVSPTKGKPTR